MPKQRVTAEVITPDWKWCDLQNPYDKKYKTGERCRFCQETKRRGQGPRHFCLLFNVELNACGDAVEKTPLCYMKWKKNQIIDLTASPVEEAPSTAIDYKDVAKMVTASVKDVLKLGKQLTGEGLPVDKSYEIAAQQIIKDWKERQ